MRVPGEEDAQRSGGGRGLARRRSGGRPAGTLALALAVAATEEEEEDEEAAAAGGGDGDGNGTVVVVPRIILVTVKLLLIK